MLKFITTIRDPRGNYISYKQFWLAQTGDLIYKYHNPKNSVVIHVIKHFQRGYKKLNEVMNYSNNNYYLLKLEDLHLNIINTMKNVAMYLNVDYKENILLNSTILNISWKGNSGFGNNVVNNDETVVKRWIKKISKGERFFVEIFFKKEIIKYSFDKITEFENKCFFNFFHIFFPFPGEFKYNGFRYRYYDITKKNSKIKKLYFYFLSRLYILLKIILKKY